MRNNYLPLTTKLVSLVHIDTVGPQGMQTSVTCNAIDHGLKLKASILYNHAFSPRGNRDNSTQLYRYDANSAICNILHVNLRSEWMFPDS